MLRRACIAVLFALMCREVVGRGPLSFHAPATVLSNCLPAQRASEPFILFLREVASRVPARATVALRIPEGPNIGPTFLIAVGQLPRQVVWPLIAWGSGPSPPLADWVASYATDFQDARYRRVASLERGALFRRLP